MLVHCRWTSSSAAVVEAISKLHSGADEAASAKLTHKLDILLLCVKVCILQYNVRLIVILISAFPSKPDHVQAYHVWYT